MKKLLCFIVIVFTFSACQTRQLEENKEDTTSLITAPKKEVHRIALQVDNTALPSLITTTDDRLLLSFVKEINDSTTQLYYTSINDTKWAAPKEILTGKNWFVNWADYPTMAENNGTLLSHFLKKSSNEKYDYDIKLNLLQKDSADWEKELELHHGYDEGEHGFVTMLPYQQNFFLTWLDGRDMAAKKQGKKGEMTLRSAEVTPEGKVINKTLLDAKTCTCCQTTAAITSNGPIVLYRDKSDDGIRDISITRMVEGKWTTPKTIHDDGWEIAGCPVNGPRVETKNNDVVVAWYTGANDTPEVKLIFSSNGGESFSSPIKINDKETLGRVDVVLLDGQNAIVSWMEKAGEKPEDITYLKAMKVTKEGSKSTPVNITEMSSTRKAGFPQMELLNHKLYFVWTVVSDEESHIESAYVSLDSF